MYIFCSFMWWKGGLLDSSRVVITYIISGVTCTDVVGLCAWKHLQTQDTKITLLYCILIRAGSVTPVSRYRDQFTSTPW